jgi:hypothetical protein
MVFFKKKTSIQDYIAPTAHIMYYLLVVKNVHFWAVVEVKFCTKRDFKHCFIAIEFSFIQFIPELGRELRGHFFIDLCQGAGKGIVIWSEL